MDETVLKVALAAFTHDTGKLVDKSVLGVDSEFVKSNEDLYQPKRDGRPTHVHALWTAAFIEKMAEFLPPQLNRREWGVGDVFINLAAAHHKPETPMQWVIATADRLSSGWDRNRFEEGNRSDIHWRDYRKTRLYPVLERLTLKDVPGKTRQAKHSYCYRLAEVSARSIFPGLESEIVPASNEEAKEEYQSLFVRFCDSLKKLLHVRDNVALWFEHFDSLMMSFASCVPAARGGDVVPDVSLYDHCRTTAALAVAMYVYHRDHDTLTVEALRNDHEPKFLVIMGDFFGIQDFIFSSHGDTRKYRSKLLRGRSFAVSLFSELTADMICREIGLPFSSVVLNAAGKFTIVAPNTASALQAVESVEKLTNRWLKDVSHGENSIGMAVVQASGEDFTQGKFYELWNSVQAAMRRKKVCRLDLNEHGGTISGYLDGFNNELKRHLCPLCGKRPSAFDTDDHPIVREAISVCRTCHDHVFLGKNLVQKTRVAVSLADEPVGSRENRLLEPIFGRYQISFFDEEDDLRQSARNGRLIRCWDLAIEDGERIPHRATAKLINGYVPRYSDEDLYDDRISDRLGSEEEVTVGDPMTFHHMAARALIPSDENGRQYQGVAALGILKADVDNLGALMSRGLAPEGNRALFTISRLATLSRQLNFYFSLYLPHLLKTDDRFREIYTVFAGGDDLFLIGPWNRTIDLARHLRASFAEYVCNNPEGHLSAGIAFEKPHTPVEQIAEAAEHALRCSKDGGRNKVTLFGETADWDELSNLAAVRDTMRDWLERKLVTKSMLYRLNGLIEMVAREKIVAPERLMLLKDMGCTKWRAYLAYTIERNAAKNLKGEEREHAVESISRSMAAWMTEYAGKLRIPLWELLYDIR
ncbi:MAG: type III-A CRISPR-associated protein Cas10/Csm1 [Thermodesulfobacteriota bacterium]